MKNRWKQSHTYLTPGNSSPIASCLAKSPVKGNCGIWQSNHSKDQACQVHKHLLWFFLCCCMSWEVSKTRHGTQPSNILWSKSWRAVTLMERQRTQFLLKPWQPSFTIEITLESSTRVNYVITKSFRNNWLAPESTIKLYSNKNT